MSPKPDRIHVRVIRLFLKFTCPEGFWKGICEICFDSAQKTYLSINKDEISCRRNKCALCGKKGRVYPVELQVPSFSKGVVKKQANVCTKCLEEVNEAYIKFKREQIGGHGNEHEHEH